MVLPKLSRLADSRKLTSRPQQAPWRKNSAVEPYQHTAIQGP